MQKTYLSLKNFLRKLNETLVIISFTMLACIVLIQVIYRYLLHSPLSWTEEAARFLQVWMVMLGSGLVMRTGSHLAIDILTGSLPPKKKRIFNILIYILMISFLLIITIFGAKIVSVTSSQTSPAMQIPMALVYLAFPIGGGLMLIEAAIRLVGFIKQNEEPAKH